MTEIYDQLLGGIGVLTLTGLVAMQLGPLVVGILPMLAALLLVGIALFVAYPSVERKPAHNSAESQSEGSREFGREVA